METEVKLLDCTLRDGGFRLSDAEGNGEAVRRFDPETVKTLVDRLSVSGIEIIELGAVEGSEEDKRGLSFYPSIEDISKIIPAKHPEGQYYAALFRDPFFPTADVPQWRPGLCEVVRVIIQYSEMRRSLDFCRDIAKKGYKLFIQPALTMRYTQDEIQLLIDTANEINAYALYIVDTYGYMQTDDVLTMFDRYDKCLHPSIRIGFHAHNNMNLAFSNVQAFLGLKTERKRIVDSCLLGMGRDAGNLQTEIISDYMNGRCGKAYDYDAVLSACELIEPYGTRCTWGYSLATLLPALRRVAIKYAVALRYRYGLSYVDIDHIFKNIPEDMRHRYTPQNTVKLLEMFHHPFEGKNESC